MTLTKPTGLHLRWWEDMADSQYQHKTGDIALQNQQETALTRYILSQRNYFLMYTIILKGYTQQ